MQYQTHYTMHIAFTATHTLRFRPSTHSSLKFLNQIKEVLMKRQKLNRARETLTIKKKNINNSKQITEHTAALSFPFVFVCLISFFLLFVHLHTINVQIRQQQEQQRRKITAKTKPTNIFIDIRFMLLEF